MSANIDCPLRFDLSDFPVGRKDCLFISQKPGLHFFHCNMPKKNHRLPFPTPIPAPATKHSQKFPGIIEFHHYFIACNTSIFFILAAFCTLKSIPLTIIQIQERKRSPYLLDPLPQAFFLDIRAFKFVQSDRQFISNWTGIARLTIVNFKMDRIRTSLGHQGTVYSSQRP